MFSMFKDLQPMSLKPTVKCRCIRTYGTPSRQTEGLSRLDCVFHDAEGTWFHIVAQGSLANTFKDKFSEGDCYAIRNFGVVQNILQHRITQHNFKGLFYSSTTIRPENGADFPRHLFNFNSFDEIIARGATDDVVLFDVIGRLINLPAPRHVRRARDGRESSVIDLVLEDQHGKSITRSLWDKYSADFLESFDRFKCDDNIVIVQFCKPCVFEGRVKVQNSFQSTKVLLNADMPEVDEFREMMERSGLPKRIVVPQAVGGLLRSEIATIGASGISTIQALAEAEEGSVHWACGDVVNVDETIEWYYLACKKCARKLEKLQQGFYCKKCRVASNTAEIRYKVIINMADETNMATFLLWDRECCQIIGLPASDLNNSLPEDEEFPPEITKTLLGKRLTVRVKVPRGDVWSYNRTYSVTALALDDTPTPPTALSQSADTSCKSGSAIECSNDGGVSNPQESPSVSRSGVGDSFEPIGMGSIKHDLTGDLSSSRSTKKMKGIVKEEKI